MLKTLVMIRHAKSSWANPLQSDFERPLNERGKNEAPEMGEKLKKLGVVPDLIISSTAKRTRQTAKKMAQTLGYDPEIIRYEDRLYHCIPSVFEEMILEIGNYVKTLFIIAHNPGITEFVNMLSDNFRIDNMPTCGVVGCRFETDDWSKFSLLDRKVFLYEFPGKHNEHK